MKLRENLGSILASVSRNPPVAGNNANVLTGKVYGIVSDENTPSKALFDKAGGWNGIGTVFYLDFEKSKDITKDNVDLNLCKMAKPFHASHQNYPVVGELIHLIDAPAPTSQITSNTGQKYYTGTINVWNNNQHNSLSDDPLGKTVVEKADIRKLWNPDAADRIYLGRYGNGIRFGRTVKAYSNRNEWSSIGNDGDPITILVNGYVTTDTGSSAPNIEEINKEMSSIYMTSTQTIPLIPGASIVNPRVNTILPKDYNSSQLIFNSDRITLNSKKDEVLLFSKTNIELNSDNIININAGRVAHINSPSIALGTNSDGSYPTEPVLLGIQTLLAFDKIVGTLQNLAYYLSLASTKDGPIVGCSSAGTQLFADLDGIVDQLNKCLSTKVYTT